MKKTNLKYIGLLLCLLLFGTSLSAQELKVMSYNIKSFETNAQATEFQIQLFADEISQYNPDIICVQELETHTSRMNMREVLTELGSLLGMYPLFGFSYVKDAGAEGMYGNGILSKYPIMNSSSALLPYSKAQSYDQRSYMWVDILVPVSGKAEGQMIRVVNTHLDHRNSPGDGQREEHAKYISARAFDPDIPTFLTGDMNASPTSKAIGVFNENCDRLCDNTGTFGKGSKLDYIFGYPKGAWSLQSYTVYRTSTLSDHYPIMSIVKRK